MKEEDAMVYRRPYLVSGSSGFALNAISKAMKKDLKVFLFIYLFVFCFSSYVLNWMFLRLILNP
jgi:Na+/alanine symporter